MYWDSQKGAWDGPVDDADAATDMAARSVALRILHELGELGDLARTVPEPEPESPVPPRDLVNARMARTAAELCYARATDVGRRWRCTLDLATALHETMKAQGNLLALVESLLADRHRVG